MDTLKRTPLYDAHVRLGARLIDFGGWEMPVQYTGIVEEHLAVRNACGLFDISHMGEIIVSGDGAAGFLNRVLTNDIRKLAEGDGQYTILCNERGGAVDDLYVYRLGSTEYLLIVNASRIEADHAWLQRQQSAPGNLGDYAIRNISDATGAIALQGPRAAEFVDSSFPGGSIGGAGVPKVTDLKKNQLAQFRFEETTAWVSRTGYTGEDGFEVVAGAEHIARIWESLLKAGQPHGLKPAGLGARDTLRTEVCYPLYGHELDENTTPLEAGLGSFVALEKGEFVGRFVLAEQKAGGVAKKLVAFKMTEKSAPPRPGYPLWAGAADGERLGQVVSGTQSPSLGIGIGLGYVPPEFAKSQTQLAVEIRGRRAAAVVVPKPIYRKPN